MPDAIVFDLFDTVVDLRRDQLPVADWGEGVKRTTVPALHSIVSEQNGMSLPEFAAVLKRADDGFKYARWAEGREIRTEERFASLLDLLGMEDDGLIDALTAAHMGWIERVASTPTHHIEVLTSLRTKCPLAICSNFSHTPTALAILEREELRPLFEVVIVSADVGIRKPRREIFEAALDGLGVAPEKAMHVGDRLDKDVLGGGGIGMETVWLTRRVEDPAAAMAAYDGPSPDRVIADISELV